MSVNQIIGYAEIEKLLPHRAPFLLIDKIKDIELGQSATGIKAVSGNEPYCWTFSRQSGYARCFDS